MSARPVGYFVHHQGRGHAERSAAIANELVAHRPVTLFSAREDIFPQLDERISLTVLPSLFEPTGREAPAMANLESPDTVHCAPVGWPSITEATGKLVEWFASAKPAVFISDVSAELGQLARLCSVPHVNVLQHGDRSDAGHMASYDGAVGLIAPYHRMLEQADRPERHLAKTHYAPGVGIACEAPLSRTQARRKLDLPQDADIVLVIAGGGGEGTPSAPLTLGARAEPDSRWITIGTVRSEWHETPPGNLEHRGWVDNPREWLAAADRVVSSCGNTTVHMVLQAGRPWVVVPEWRYFDEQLCKAEALDRANLAAVAPHWPSHAGAWGQAWARAAGTDLDAGRSMIDPDAAAGAAEWLDALATKIWRGTDDAAPSMKVVA